jgi:2-polyprenyl-3-methyl-5-hydroxy-6-metoxy-1,4-benzoquinol methylase
MDDPGLPRPNDGDAETVRLQAEEHPLIEDVPPSTPAEHCLRLMHLRAYDEAVKHAAGRDVLDVGCNTGYGTIRFAPVARRVGGVDVSPLAIEAARERAIDGRPEFIQTSGFELPFPAATFDLVTSFQVLEHVPDATAFLRELARVLRPDGIMILATPNAATRLYPGMTPWNRFHVHEYRADELAGLLGTVFDGVRVLGMVGAPELYETEIRRVDAARQRIRRTEEAAARQEAARAAAAARAEARASAPRAPRPWPIRVARAVLPGPVRAWLKSVLRPTDDAHPRRTATAAAPPSDEVTTPAPEPSLDLDAFLRFTVDDLWYVDTELDRSMDLLAVCEVHSATGPAPREATV